ncbi:MAG: electron transport complex subunit RsxG [Pseudomonadales bacterium]
MMRGAITKNGLLLGLFAMVTTAIIAATQLSTKDLIAEQFRLAKEKALLEIVTRERHDNQLLDDTVEVSGELLGYSEPRIAFIARYQDAPVGIILPAVAPDGYSGKIELLVGVNTNGSVAGVRIVKHAETPGLGDKVELRKSDWVLSFNGKSIGQPAASGWAVKKDKGEFDQFTGATITPRAVTHAVFNALQYFGKNQHLLNARAKAPISDTLSASTPKREEANVQ